MRRGWSPAGLPGFATTVAELWIDVGEDNADDAADPGVNGH